jgi:hypothetical protein
MHPTMTHGFYNKNKKGAVFHEKDVMLDFGFCSYAQQYCVGSRNAVARTSTASNYRISA